MCDMEESTLDLHFLSQLRGMGELYANISKENFTLSQRWMHLFYMASKQDKYARNCLMLLMQSQLKEMRKLAMPFTDIKNEQRKLSDVLGDYSGKIRDDDDDEPEEVLDENEDMDSTKSCCGSSRYSPTAPSLSPSMLSSTTTQVNQFEPNLSPTKQDSQPKIPTPNDYQLIFAENRGSPIPSQYQYYATIKDSSTIEIFPIKSVSSTSPSTLTENESARTTTPEINLEKLSQENEALLKEIHQLHAQSLEDEKRFGQTDVDWKKQMPTSPLKVPAPPGTKFLLPKLKSNFHDVLRRLKDWTPANGALDLLTHSLKEILDDSSETKNLLSQLDRKLEEVLSYLLEQSAERGERNVRILYDQLFKQQQETMHNKEELLHREKLSLALGRQQLETRIMELRKREQFFWKQQAQAMQFYPSSHYQVVKEMPINLSTASSEPQIPVDFESSCGCSDCHAELEEQVTPKKNQSAQTSRQTSRQL